MSTTTDRLGKNSGRFRFIAAAALAGTFVLGAWVGAWQHPANGCQEDEVWDTLRARCTHVEGNVLDDPQGMPR